MTDQFTLALWKRGFVTLPRLLIDFALELDLDYEVLGKTLALMAAMGACDGPPDGEYRVNRHEQPQQFQESLTLAVDLAESDLVRFEVQGDQLTYSFAPLFVRLQAIWAHHLEHRAAASTQVAATSAQGQLMQLSESRKVIGYAEGRLGRPLSDREVQDLIDWITEYGFADGVVQAIFDEALEKGITRFSYLNGIAREWHELGIKELGDVEAAQLAYRKVMAQYGQIVRYLGLGRRLTQAEVKLLEKWFNEWGFSEEVILKACDTTVNIKDPNFGYIDRVLATWHQRGVRTPAEAEQAAASWRRKRPGKAAPREPIRSASYYDQFLKK